MFIQEADRHDSDIAFDRGEYFGSNVNGSITIDSLKPFLGKFSFSGQDERASVTIIASFVGS
jgi:hypothetical protein